jgi:hypothetical protein
VLVLLHTPILDGYIAVEGCVASKQVSGKRLPGRLPSRIMDVKRRYLLLDVRIHFDSLFCLNFGKLIFKLLYFIEHKAVRQFLRFYDGLEDTRTAISRNMFELLGSICFLSLLRLCSRASRLGRDLCALSKHH